MRFLTGNRATMILLVALLLPYYSQARQEGCNILSSGVNRTTFQDSAAIEATVVVNVYADDPDSELLDEVRITGKNMIRRYLSLGSEATLSGAFLSELSHCDDEPFVIGKVIWSRDLSDSAGALNSILNKDN